MSEFGACLCLSVCVSAAEGKIPRNGRSVVNVCVLICKLSIFSLLSFLLASSFVSRCILFQTV